MPLPPPRLAAAATAAVAAAAAAPPGAGSSRKLRRRWRRSPLLLVRCAPLPLLLPRTLMAPAWGGTRAATVQLKRHPFPRPVIAVVVGIVFIAVVFVEVMPTYRLIHWLVNCPINQSIMS